MRPKLFISFTSRDHELVRRLFDRLRPQPIAEWDYSVEGEEVPVGVSLSGYLTDKIRASDVFVPIVTHHSTKAKWTVFELNEAFRLACPLIPIVVDDIRLAEVDQPFSQLAQVRYLPLASDSKTSLEQVIRRLCDGLRVDYVPPPTTDPRLPFMPRFYDEVRSLVPRNLERENAIYKRLMAIAADIQSCYEAGDYGRAAKCVDYFLSMCEYEFPRDRFYFAYVIKALCLCTLGRTAEAASLARSLLDHPRLDENLYGILGYAYLHQEAYREALACYQEAARRKPDDAGAHSWLVHIALTHPEAGRVDLEEALGVLENGIYVAEQDRLKGRSLAAVAQLRAGKVELGVRMLAPLVRDNTVDAHTMVELADALFDAGDVPTAVDLLERANERFPDHENAQHRLASMRFAIGEFRHARALFDRLIEQHPHDRQYLADALQAAYAAGDIDAAQGYAYRILDQNMVGPPTTAADFWMDGLANWVLGRRERAEYDFERSGYGADVAYELVLTGRPSTANAL